MTLLYRSTRRLALTPDGEQRVEAAREMVAAAERGLDRASGRSATPTGALRLTAPAFLAETTFCRDVAAFSVLHPKVSVTALFTEVPRDLLRDGLDLAIRIGKLEDSTHRVRKVAEMKRLLVTSPRYAAARAPARKPRDLETWESIRLASRPAELQLVHKRQPSATVTPLVKLATDSAAAIRALVIAGAGIATIPEVMARHELARGRLAEVLPGWQPATLGVFAVWPANARHDSLTQRFVDFIAGRLAALFSDEPNHRHS